MKYLWIRIKMFFAQYEPRVCFCCKRIIYKKDARTEKSTLGVWVDLCPKCHKDIFHPMGEE